MKKIPVLLLLFILTFVIVSQALAADFSQAYIRLNSNKPSAALSGTVCASPSSAAAGTENKVLITFPNDFSIYSTASNFTTNTANLPSGATAWPGIGSSATAISSKTVTLASGDLTNGSSIYCFNFTANSSTTGSMGNKEGNLTTTNSSNTTIDSSNFGLSIVSNDQISVTATVPADPLDFTHSIEKLTSESHFLPNTQIEYQITYNSLLATGTTLGIEASWSQGTVDGDSVPSVDILNYVSGSATNAYSSTPAVIDTVNRTITWSISSFPAGLSDQTVNFKLKTRNDYAGTTRVAFTTSARLLPPGTATSYDNLTNYYTPGQLGTPPTFGEDSSSSSTNESSTSTTTTSDTTTTSSTASQSTTSIDTININTISSENSSIEINTYNFSDVEVKYGTSIDNLNQSITSQNSTSHLIELLDLIADTKYYFRIYVTDSAGNKFTSDIYTFKTAKDSSAAIVNPITLVATSDNTIVSNISQGGNNTLVLPVGSDFQIKFAMQDRASVTNLQAILENKNVLGLSFPAQANASSESINLIETLSGIYTGNLKTNLQPGNYTLTARVFDKNGNITEQELANVKVVKKFTIVSKDDKKPVEGARVFLYFYTPSTKTYKEIPASSIANGNPQFTNRNGELELVLPQGKYKAEITDLRHAEKTVKFEIGPSQGQEYPVVEMEGAKITLLSLINYYKLSINDVFIKNTQVYSKALTGSTRFFDLVSLVTLGVLVIITLLAFSKRHHVPVLHIPSYFYYLVDRRDKNERYIHGVVYNEDDKPIKSANVYLMDKTDEKIISHKKTNKYGEFFFKKGKSKYLIMAMTKGYTNSPVFEYHERKHLKFKINLKKEEEGLHLFGRLANYISIATGLSFEVLLVFSFVFELLFINSFGAIKTLPFLLITILNLILWILHVHNKSHSNIT